MCSQQADHSPKTEWVTSWRAVLLFRGSQKGWRNVLTEIPWSSTKTNAKSDILRDNHIQHPSWGLAAWVGRKQFCMKKPEDPDREPIMYWAVLARMCKQVKESGYSTLSDTCGAAAARLYPVLIPQNTGVVQRGTEKVGGWNTWPLRWWRNLAFSQKIRDFEGKILLLSMSV